MKLGKIVIIALAAAAAGAGMAAALSRATDVDWHGQGKRWWAHVEYLASDALEGRNTGSEGYKKAAAYVAEQFGGDGLRPAGSNGYYQPVRFAVQQVDAERSSLELVRGGQTMPLALGEDAVIGGRCDLAESVEAPLEFVGYGFAVPEAKYDDLAGVDLKGKIAVFLYGGPKGIPSAVRAHSQSTAERAKALRAVGAVGTVGIFNPRSMDIPWPRVALNSHQASMMLADAEMQDARGLRTCPVVNPAHAEKLFAGSGHTFEEVLAADAAGKPLPHFPLGAALRAKQTVKRWEVESPNVVAVSPGSDPTLAKEYVALSAHLDHLGIGEPIGGDRVYHGAMDNGSGVATMLEVARMLHDSGAHPKRSLLFVIVCGEEKGLLGSKYFAAHPTVDGKSIVADINVDMFLPLTPLKYLEVQGLGESSLGADVREVVRELGTGITVQADQQPDRNLFIRSDQYNFILHGIPSLAFKFSYLPDSPEAKQYKDWLTHNYHAPSDNAKQPVDLVGAAEFNQIILNLAVRVANDAARPRWEPNSFFRRFAGAGGN